MPDLVYEMLRQALQLARACWKELGSDVAYAAMTFAAEGRTMLGFHALLSKEQPFRRSA